MYSTTASYIVKYCQIWQNIYSNLAGYQTLVMAAMNVLDSLSNSLIPIEYFVNFDIAFILSNLWSCLSKNTVSLLLSIK